MPRAGDRRREGAGYTDLRREGIGIVSIPSADRDVITDAIDTVYNLLSASVIVGGANEYICTGAVNEVYDLLTVELASMEYHKTHSVAALTIPAVTIGAAENVPIEDDRANYATDLLVDHSVIVEIRVHASMAGNAQDRVNATLYYDQVIEELKTHINLGLYRLMRFEGPNFNIFFEETETYGAVILAEYHTAKVYEQA